MRQTKKVWITEYNAGLHTLSLESANPSPEYRRVHAEERSFPDRDTGQERHTVMIRLLDEDDLWDIYRTLKKQFNWD